MEMGKFTINSSSSLDFSESMCQNTQFWKSSLGDIAKGAETSMICHPSLVNDSDVNDHAATLHLSTLEHVEVHQINTWELKLSIFMENVNRQRGLNMLFFGHLWWLLGRSNVEDGLSGEEVRNEDLKMRTKRPFTNKLDQQPTAKTAKFWLR